MSIEMRAQWGDMIKGVGLEITEAVYQGANTYRPGVLSILKTENTDAAQVNYTDFTDFTDVGYRDEADNNSEMRRFKGFDSKYVVQSIGGTIFVTEESIADNKFADALEVAAKQGKKMSLFTDKLGYQLFNQGWTNNNTDKAGFKLNWFNDGKPQFSVSHPSAVPGGSTQSNASSTGIVISEDNLETGLLALSMQTDDLGELNDYTGVSTIVTSNVNERKARIILETAQKVDSEHNNVNIYADGSVKLITSKWLSTKAKGLDTAWYLVDSDAHRLYHIDREGVVVTKDYHSRNRVHEFNIHRRLTAASKGWKATWGSLGNAQAYSA